MTRQASLILPSIATVARTVNAGARPLVRAARWDPAATRGFPRLSTLAAAAELYLRAKERREVDQAIRRAYSGKPDELLAEIEDLIEVQEWPER